MMTTDLAEETTIAMTSTIVGEAVVSPCAPSFSIDYRSRGEILNVALWSLIWE